MASVESVVSYLILSRLKGCARRVMIPSRDKSKFVARSLLYSGMFTGALLMRVRMDFLFHSTTHAINILAAGEARATAYLLQQQQQRPVLYSVSVCWLPKLA